MKWKLYTKKEINALENKAYLQGYEAGKAAGKQEMLFENYTVNQIRAVLGLSPLLERK